MMTKWWIIAAAVFCIYEALGAPQLASLIHVQDNEKQTTLWKNANDMKKALNFQYPVLPEDKDHPMPEKTLNINGRIDLSRQTRQSSDDPAPTPPPLQDYLLFANRQFLVSINKDGTGVEALRLTHDSGIAPNAIAIDYDIRKDFLFWSDVQFQTIFIAHFDGSNLTALITTNITTPDGLAWDWINNKLYWTDAEDNDIEVYDIYKGLRKKLIQSGPNANPRDIVLDQANRVMYWTDWGTPATIERASMDGTSHVVLHNTTLVWPNGLTIDYATQTLYWADAYLDRIESSGTDGKQRQLLITIFILHPFGIQFSQGYIYWTDWQLKAVLKANVSQTNLIETVISNLLLDPMAIREVSLEGQPMSVNPCGASNGGCSHLCLLSSSNPVGYSCACPDGFELDASQKNCTKNHPSSVGVTAPAINCTNSCQNGGTCISPSTCVCAAGWSGEFCQDAICTPLCMNGGNCTSPGICECKNGWRGIRCQNAICAPSCRNGGTCTEPGLCSCTAHWQGSTCEQAVCDEGFCLNGGTCIRHNFCSCTVGWSGKKCELPVCTTSCMHGRCTGPDTCSCDRGWEGNQCEKPICNPSCSNGTCLAPDFCVCDPGWEGVLCREAICEPACLNGGQCDSPNQCTCTAEYKGSLCEEAICFPPDGCLNGGECVRPSLCACQAYWTGLRCDEAICKPSCIHGECVSRGTCYCHTGWSGSRCEQAVCFPPSGCLNGGYCYSPGLCACASGWTGEKCDEGVCPRGCYNGDCVEPNVCSCHSGWTGEKCDQALCYPDCQNGGTCVFPGHCVCPTNTHGYRCQTILPV